MDRIEPKIDEKQLSNWKLIDAIRTRLEALLTDRPKVPTELDKRRRLAADEYFLLVLFSFLNPVLKTMRGLCAASDFERVQEDVCGRHVSMGSFSEAQHLFDPSVLTDLLRSCAAEALPVFGDVRVQNYVKELTAHDGTLLPALPRMAWALWMDEKNRAARLHLDFSVFDQVPTGWVIEPANKCERKVWDKQIKKGAFYVCDRYFGHDYNLLGRVVRRGANFVVRLHNNANFEVLESRPLTDADIKAGVVRDCTIRLGRDKKLRLFRLVEVHVGEHQLLLLTNRMDLPAELVALIYRYRWQVELFFKWIKCVLQCRHWLAESPEGVAIQVYCALIVSVMLAVWTGKRPSKRVMEALQLYWVGYVSADELLAVLKKSRK